MKRLFGLVLTSIIGLLALSTAPANVAAQDAAIKPVVVLAFSGYDELRGDLDFIGQLSDNPELAKSFDGLVAMATQFQGLAGLDKGKPWGGMVALGDAGFTMNLFLPVTDLKKLLGAIGHIVGQPEDIGDGVKKLESNNATLFIKQKGPWVFVAQDPGQLANPPADPLKLLGSLPKDYDIAAQINVQNVPPPLRQMAIDQVKQGAQAGLQRQENETDAQYEMRTKLLQQQLDQLTKAINELDQLTVGYNTDAKGHRAYLDIMMTALPGSSLAKQAALTVSSSTKFGGFLDDENVFQAHFNSRMDSSDIESTLTMIKSLRSTMQDSIAKDEDLKDPEEKKTITALANEAVDVLEATVKKGVADGGAALVGEGPFTFVVGLGVEGGDRLETIVQKVFSMSKDKKAEDYELNWNAGQHQGVTFATIIGDWPQDDNDTEEQIEQLQDFFGEDLTITFGFGKDRIYFALGEDGIDSIKEIIDGSSAGVPPTMPMQMTLALAPLMAFAADQDEDNAILSAIADSLDESGKDKLRLNVKQITNGVQYRFEVEEGVLKAIGQSAKAAQQAAGS